MIRKLGNAKYNFASEKRLQGGGGGGGSPGTSGLVVLLFKRSASAPAVPSTTSTLTFATGVLTGHDNGWTQAVPTTDGNPLYVTTAKASGTGSSDTIATGEWATPTILAQDGATGATGATGAAGTNGTNGATGATGAAGTNGTNGAAWAIYSATVTTANDLDKESTVAHVGMTSAGTLRAWLKAGADNDENNADMMPEAIAAAFPGTDTVTLVLSSTIPMSGPVKIAYEVLA